MLGGRAQTGEAQQSAPLASKTIVTGSRIDYLGVMHPKKQQLIELVLTQLNQDLEALIRSAQAAHEAATHEESKAEDSHDTRGLEASYLAGAQQARIESLRKIIASYHFSKIPDFKTDDPIQPGACIQLESEGKNFFYFLATLGGGTSVLFEGKNFQVITPKSPLGEALLGKFKGEEVVLETPTLEKEYEVIHIW